MSNALTVELTTFQTQLDSMGEKLAASLPSHISLEAFKRTTLVALQTNPALLSASRRHVLMALQHAAGAGLLPDGREGAIVVRWNSAERAEVPVFQPMVQGLMKLARQAGLRSFRAHVVYEGEHFRVMLGDEDKIEHFRDINLVDIRKAVAVYAIAELADGTIIRRHMPASRVMAIKAGVAFKKDGTPKNIPWNGPHEVAMWEKSALINLSKWLPLSPEREGDRRLLDTIRRDEAMDGHHIDAEAETEEPAAPLALTEEARLNALEATIAAGSAREEVAEPAPEPPPSANAYDPMIVQWMEETERAFAKVQTVAAMRKLIGAINANMDILRQDAPELAAHVDAAIKAATMRLKPEGEAP
jgi:recombination protein RecT